MFIKTPESLGDHKYNIGDIVRVNQKTYVIRDISFGDDPEEVYYTMTSGQIFSESDIE